MFKYQPEWQGPLSGRSFEKQTEDFLNGIESRVDEIDTRQTPSDATPMPPGVGSAGTALEYSRGDHSHPLQSSVSGSAGSLETARTISMSGEGSGSASFDGSSDISIPLSVACIADGSTERRAIANRFADVVNALDFGAKGDGLTDDTDALNAAVAAAAGKTLFIPAGTYITSTGLRIKSNTRVVGAGKFQTTIKLSDSAPQIIDCITNEQNWWNDPDAVEQYGGYTEAMQLANHGNINIVVEDLTADGNNTRAYSAGDTNSGSAVHFANVKHLELRNVRGINGFLHCIDISSSMYTDIYDASGFTPLDEGKAKADWYIGKSEDVLLENCEGVDPKWDDCITTHYSSNITLINPQAFRNLSLSQVLALGNNKHGVEIDDGSYDVIIYGGTAENCYAGLQIKGHPTAYPAHNVCVDGFTSRDCMWNYCVSHKSGTNLSENLTIKNCSSYMTSTSSDLSNGRRHFYIGDYSNINIENVDCYGDNQYATSVAFQLFHACKNTSLKNISFKDIKLGPTSGDVSYAATLIYINSGQLPKLAIENVTAVNCAGGNVIKTYSETYGLYIDGVFADREIDTSGTAAVYIGRNVAKTAGVVVKNIQASNYAAAYQENGPDGIALPSSSSRFGVIGSEETFWKRAKTDTSISPSNSYAVCYGWYSENQDLQYGERLLIGFKDKIKTADEKIVGYIGSHKDSGVDNSGNYGLVLGACAGYVPFDAWNITYEGRLYPSTNNQIVGYANGPKPKIVYVGTLYTDDGTVHQSDERSKTNIAEIPDNVLDAWEEVEWVQFQFIEAAEKKGEEKARIHSGAIAQRVKDVFEKNGIDPFKYGLICLVSWDEKESPTKTAGDRYGLRYIECLAIEAACQRRKTKRLEERVADLERRIGQASDKGI